MPTDSNPITAQLQRRQAERDEVLPAGEPPPEPSLGPLWRSVRACPPPEYATAPPPTLDAARATIRTEISDYLNLASPAHVLLVRAAAGVGKTQAGVETAEACAARGWRVGYAGPRHDFFADVTALAQHPHWWLEWMPRQEGNERKIETCIWPREINGWISKGYQGIDFCARVCKWDYVNKRCVWHKQKATERPIIYIQHQHIAGGHPLDFRVVIGDENPLAAFLHRWNIPAGAVKPSGMAWDEPLTEILVKLAGLCAGEEMISGLPLIDRLGGATAVLEVCKSFVVPTSAIAAADIHSASEAERADYFHLPNLVRLLEREAEAAADERLYPPRIVAGQDNLTLLLRRWPDTKLPPHVIWLDATGNERIYAELFGRPVKVVDAVPKLAGTITVVTDRTNGKGDFKAAQARQVIRKVADDYGFRKPAVITFQQVEAELAGDWPSAHFYGARGTNRLQQCDALFVVGAPMPHQDVLRSMAAQIYFERMTAFSDRWLTQYAPYSYIDPVDGQGREYPAGGFWMDPDLQALVWQQREAEIIQAVHRARPVLRDVPIYLLCNLPIRNLPIDRLVTVAELMGLVKPDEVRSLYDWQMLTEFITGRATVSPKDIRQALGVSWETAKKYWQLLINSGEWEISTDAVAEKRRGRQSLVIKRITSLST